MTTPPTARRLRRLAAPCLAGLLLLGACSSDGSDAGGSEGEASTGQEAAAGTGTGELLAGLADDTLVPRYEQLAADLSALTGTIADLCAAPGTPALDAARQAWDTAATTWQASRPGAIGPANERRIMSAVGFEARPATIDELLEGTDPVDPAAVADEGAAARGLYALEHGLFGTGADELSGPDGARRCTYLSSVAQLAATAATAVAADWVADFRDTFVDGMGGEQQMSVSELVNEITHRLQELDEKGLRDLAAAASLDDLAENRLDGPADHGMADRQALLAGIADLLGDDDAGVIALVAARSPETAERLAAATEAAVTALDALPPSMAAAFEEGDAVEAASDAVAELKVVLSTEAASQLGVTISFSDSDGDS